MDQALRMVTLSRRFDAQALGAYAQDLVQLSPEWKALLGLRWDRFSGGCNSPVASTAAATRRSRSDSLWSKCVGLIYQPAPFQSYHFSFSTSFNTSGDTYLYDALGSNTPPGGSLNYELGAKFDLADGKLNLGLALFHAVKTHERNRDSESVTLTSYVLSGQRHAAGLELDLAGRITPQWALYASYACIPDAAVDKGTSSQGEVVGSRPGLTPHHSSTVWSTYQVTPSWRLGAGLTLRCAMAPQLVTTFEAPGYVTADLMAEFKLHDMSFKPKLGNLSNKQYVDMLYRGHDTPGRGRPRQFTGSYRFWQARHSMMWRIPGVLSGLELAQMHATLAPGPWHDGQRSAGPQAAAVKRNQQFSGQDGDPASAWPASSGSKAWCTTTPNAPCCSRWTWP